ncbi:coiled-coil domain-containing protein [Campylobacter coli]
MTAYVHIGTMKTGTSSIQNFLYLNRSLLQKQNYYYPISIKNIGRLNDHNPFAHKFNTLLNKTDDLKIFSREFKNLNNEIKMCNCDKIIISMENVQWLLNSQQKIKYFYDFLIYIFDNIKIIVYLRDVAELFISMCSQAIKDDSHLDYHFLYPYQNKKSKILSDYKQTLQWWGEIFGKENLIVRLFNKNEFYRGDLLKDFIYSVDLKWDEKFQIPIKENETLDLIGFELLSRVNRLKPFMFKSRYFDIVEYFDRNCTNVKQYSHLKFQPPKEIMQSYINYFEESNEWVRQEFFPHKERLFPKKDLSNYKENYELKEMKPEYWDKIAEFIADIVKTKNQNIADKTIIIQNKDKVIVNQTNQINSLQTTLKDNKAHLIQAQNLNNTLNKTIQEKDIIINSNTNQIDQLQNNIQEKSTQLNQLQSKLSFQTQYGTAKSRIQNQLSYKLGQAMIINSKSLLGYLIMPMILLNIIISHKQAQKAYKLKIKKNPNLALPPLESYPDYKEALKEKECLTYKLGEALIKASNNWYGGGYIKLLLEIRKLKKEFKKK